MLRVGLTGGIAAGKTTVADFLSELGAFVIDADELARQVMAPGGTAHAEVTERFGDLERRSLARVVFGDSEAREDLNRIVHPRVRAEADRHQHRLGRGRARDRHDAFDVELARSEEMTDRNHVLVSDVPDHFVATNRIDQVDVQPGVARRMRSLEELELHFGVDVRVNVGMRAETQMSLAIAQPGHDCESAGEVLAASPRPSCRQQ